MQQIPDNYTEITQLNQLQALLEIIFQRFHNICQKYGLVYNMAFGTLLGAVRHQGIIPWDDDIDVTMPREDYERLLEILQNEPDALLEVRAYPMENYVYPYAKICARDTILIEEHVQDRYAKLGLFIDVFPMDNYPRGVTQKERMKDYKRARWYSRCLQWCVMKVEASPCWYKKAFVIFKYLRWWICNLFGYTYFLKKHIQENQRYKDTPCACLSFLTHLKACITFVLEKEDYYKRRLYPFGKSAFWGMENYDDVLTNTYGDYMTPPPENKRVPKHDYRVYVDPKWIELADL